jgi:hypothetical protein
VSLHALARLHALAAWAATAGLVAAAWLFARGARTRRLAGGIAAALVLAAAGLGVALHDPYRAHLRQRLFVEAPGLGWLFERKLHLAFAAVLLAVSALATALHLDRRPPGAAGARDLQRAAALGWTASAALALAASIASAIVAGRAHF